MSKSFITKRGFNGVSFKDNYGISCSIQESSSAEEPKVWFGCDNSRMHLTIPQIKELLPILERFIKTGEVNE